MRCPSRRCCSTVGCARRTVGCAHSTERDAPAGDVIVWAIDMKLHSLPRFQVASDEEQDEIRDILGFLEEVNCI